MELTKNTRKLSVCTKKIRKNQKKVTKISTKISSILVIRARQNSQISSAMIQKDSNKVLNSVLSTAEIQNPVTKIFKLQKITIVGVNNLTHLVIEFTALKLKNSACSIPNKARNSPNQVTKLLNSSNTTLFRQTMPSDLVEHLTKEKFLRAAHFPSRTRIYPLQTSNSSILWIESYKTTQPSQKLALPGYWPCSRNKNSSFIFKKLSCSKVA